METKYHGYHGRQPWSYPITPNPKILTQFAIPVYLNLVDQAIVVIGQIEMRSQLSAERAPKTAALLSAALAAQRNGADALILTRVSTTSAERRLEAVAVCWKKLRL